MINPSVITSTTRIHDDQKRGLRQVGVIAGRFVVDDRNRIAPAFHRNSALTETLSVVAQTRAAGISHHDLVRLLAAAWIGDIELERGGQLLCRLVVKS